jgi:hypothetical protein
MCPQEHLVIISYTTGLSFALERIGPLAAIIITVFYLLVLYLLALSNTPENLFASIYSESLIKTTCQHLLLPIGFNTLIYRKYYDTPPILVGHHWAMRIGVIRWLLCPTVSDCYRWRGGDEVNDRPVGKPQEEGMMNIAASFSLSKKPRFN